jgi:hypothetical protein
MMMMEKSPRRLLPALIFILSFFTAANFRFANCATFAPNNNNHHDEQSSSSTKRPPSLSSDLVDQVEAIEVGSRQLVITTSKQGPPDTANVQIWLVDIVSGEKPIPPMNLTGILLILTRGFRLNDQFFQI